jgi:hypothetical protein
MQYSETHTLLDPRMVPLILLARRQRGLRLALIDAKRSSPVSPECPRFREDFEGSVHGAVLDGDDVRRVDDLAARHGADGVDGVDRPAAGRGGTAAHPGLDVVRVLHSSGTPVAAGVVLGGLAGRVEAGRHCEYRGLRLDRITCQRDVIPLPHLKNTMYIQKILLAVL